MVPSGRATLPISAIDVSRAGAEVGRLVRPEDHQRWLHGSVRVAAGHRGRWPTQLRNDSAGRRHIRSQAGGGVLDIIMIDPALESAISQHHPDWILKGVE